MRTNKQDHGFKQRLRCRRIRASISGLAELNFKGGGACAALSAFREGLNGVKAQYLSSGNTMASDRNRGAEGIASPPRYATHPERHFRGRTSNAEAVQGGPRGPAVEEGKE
jgi:hypothetical protein